MDVEVWKQVVGFDGYDVSDWGRVRSWRRTGGGLRAAPVILALKTRKSGHLEVGMNRSGKRLWRMVHVLVLEAFVGPRPAPDMDTRHFPDRDPTNNRLDNLQWGTKKENSADRVVHDTLCSGRRNGMHTAWKHI